MQNYKYDYLIVGAGLFGATWAALARENHQSCLIIEKRDVVGGNLYTPHIDEIPVHKYGAHIFHTSKKYIWDFVNNYCHIRNFINSPVANYKGELYNLPFNMNTFTKLWLDVKTMSDAKKKIEFEKEEAVKNGHNLENPTNLEDQAISLVGTTIYRKLIKEYTEKQWGRDCKELPSEIIKRLPLRFVFDNNYFNDEYQGIPDGGYNLLIKNLIGNTPVVLNTDYNENRDYWNKQAKKIIYTGPIDAAFDYKYGKLEWRTVKFEIEKLNQQDFQSNPVVNYTSHDEPYTRIIEHKYFDKASRELIKDYTIISKEYSKEFEDGDEPYYPINNEKNNELYKKYQIESLYKENFYACGRLGSYSYYDMDDTIIKAKDLFNTVSQDV